MAEVQTPPAANGQEPSMEEILASIRKIISDEPAPADSADGKPAEEVLELTQMVQDDGSVVNVDTQQPQAPAKEEAKMPETPPPAPEPPKAEPPPPKALAPAKPDKPLVAESTAAATASALSSLASTVEIEKLASATPESMTLLGNGGRTLENMVMEIMKPMIKQWLDQNLPAAVDRLVQKEIERISRKAKD